jgi:hypothetical protein
MPKELTPARRGWPSGTCQASRRVATRNGVSSKPISGLGRSTCRLGGISRCSRASTVLISPAAPAAESQWPTLLLTEPTAQKPVRSVPRRKARVSARISIGSPRGVPLPWAST